MGVRPSISDLFILFFLQTHTDYSRDRAWKEASLKPNKHIINLQANARQFPQILINKTS